MKTIIHLYITTNQKENKNKKKDDKKMKKLVIKVLTSLSLFALIVSPLTVNAQEMNQTMNFYDDCYENIDSVVIYDSNDSDITNQEKQKFIELYLSDNLENVNNYFIDNGYSISCVSNSKDRAFEGKTFQKIFTKTAAKTINLQLGGTQTIQITWQLKVRCNYSINTQTEKISYLGDPVVSLVNTAVGGETQELDLDLHESTAAKNASETHFNIYMNYSIKTKRYYFPFESINYGPYVLNQYV